MGDNAFFELIQEEAMEKGRAEGLEQGLEKGLQKGLKKGLQKGHAEGARRAVLRVLARRFGELSEDLRARVEKVESVKSLERLHDEAITCPGIEAFREFLGTA